MAFALTEKTIVTREYKFSGAGLPIHYKQEEKQIEITAERCSTYICKKGISYLSAGVGACIGFSAGAALNLLPLRMLPIPDEIVGPLIFTAMMLGAGIGGRIGNRAASTLLNCCCNNKKHTKIL